MRRDTVLAMREGNTSSFSAQVVGASVTEVREARWGGGSGLRSRSHLERVRVELPIDSHMEMWVWWSGIWALAGSHEHKACWDWIG